MPERLAAMRDYFMGGATRDFRQRREWLRSLANELQARRNEILAALHEDLGKSPGEALMTEFMPLAAALKMLRRNLKRWGSPRCALPSLLNFPASGRIVPEPYGVVLIVSTWNYPLLLSLEPLAGAVAAGNCAVLAPSPTAHAMAACLGDLVKAALPPEAATVVRGEPVKLVEAGYDYLFFTGSARYGAEVASRAAARLTPTTLELGGKSPCIVTASANLKVAARRIVWAKFLNAGQTCVAPDYLLVEPAVKDELMRRLRDAIKDFYGENPQESPDYGRIVNEFHFERLSGLLKEGRLIAGGERDERQRYIAPTVLDQVGWDSPVMGEEIFGPILPVLDMPSIEEAVAAVNRRPRPLALYLFSASRRERDLVVASTSSGAVVVNDAVMQMVNPSMPFGGVGASGYGAYHGRLTFDTFSHFKPVMRRLNILDWPVRYPPFSGWKRRLLERFSR